MSATENSAPTPRSPAQIAAAKINGSKSHGPVSEQGRQASALNATRHGMNADFLVLPHEDPEEYAAVMDSWVEALGPTTVAEAQLVAAIGDSAWKLQRLRRIEHQRELSIVEDKLKATPEWHRAKAAETAHAAVAGLAQAIEARPVPPEMLSEMGGFLAAINETKSMVQAVETLPLAVVAQFEKAVAALEDNSITRVSLAHYQALGAVAAKLVPTLKTVLDTEQAALPGVKARIAATEIAMTDADGKLAKRYLDLTLGMLDRHLETLRATRALVKEVGEKAKALAEEFKVEIRVAH